MPAFEEIYPPVEQRDDMELIDLVRVSAAGWRKKNWKKGASPWSVSRK